MAMRSPEEIQRAVDRMHRREDIRFWGVLVLALLGVAGLLWWWPF